MNPAIYYLSGLDTYGTYIPIPTPEMPDRSIWDQKNLNTVTYSDGTTIPRVQAGWDTLKTGAWRYYANTYNNSVIYGRLYNWYAMMGIWKEESVPPTPTEIAERKNIAPEGWSVANYTDWLSLSTSLGGDSSSGATLKQAGTSIWVSPNTGTNTSNFTALPGGTVSGSGVYGFIGTQGFWLVKDAPAITNMQLINTSNALLINTGGTISFNRGSSIRLIKNTIVIPGFTTTPLSNIKAKSFDTGGNIPTYSESPTDRGIVWGTLQHPTILNSNKISSGSGFGSYTVSISTASPNTTYYIRAYAVLPSGNVYADEISVTTPSGVPVVLTTEITDPLPSVGSVVGGGEVTSDGGYTVTARGICWSYSTNPTIALATRTNNGTGVGIFTSNINHLSPSRTYYVRAYATNEIATAYGPQIDFITPPGDILRCAYSLRRVVPTFTGPAIRIAKGNNTTFQEFEFDPISGELDQAAILAWVGTGIGFVSMWYDQGPNGITLGPANSVYGRQPRVANAGAVYLKNGKLSMEFGLNAFSYLRNTLLTGLNTIPLNDISMFVVASNNGAGVAPAVLLSNTRFHRPNQAGDDFFTYDGVNRINLGVTSSTNKIYSNLSTSTSVSAWKNNVSLGAPVTVANNTSLATQINVGMFFPDNYNGSIQEVLIYNGDALSRSSITANAIGYYTIV